MEPITSPEQLNADTWELCDDLRVFAEYLASGKRRPDRKYRLLLVAVLRAMWHLLPDPRSRAAVEAMEQYADGRNARLLRRAAEAATRAYEQASRSLDVNDPVMLRDSIGSWRVCQALERALVGDPGRPHWAEVIADIEEIDAHLVGHDSADAAALHLRLFHDLFPNPFRPMAFEPVWRTSTAIGLARTMYESRDFAAMPILADALEEAGCDSPGVLAHCRGDGPHVRGCWVVDLVLGKS